MRRLGQTPDGETIGQRIRRVRLARKLSQDALSVPGVSGAYISRIEAGQREPSLKALRKLAERLGVTAEYLETGLEVPQAAERALQLADAELELRVGHDLDRAERALTAIVGEGTRDATGGRALAALGLLAARRGSNAEAIRNLEAAIATGFVRPESRSDVFEGLAAAYVATNRTGAAIELLERCLAAVDEPALQLRYRTFLGTTLATAGSLNRARDELAVATEEAERYAAPGARVLVYWSQARVAWMAGDSASAQTFMARAIGHLEATEDTLQVARAHLAAAQMSALDEDDSETAFHLDRAERLFELAGDRDDLGALRVEQAKHAARNDRADEAMTRARQALELVGDDARYSGTALHGLALAEAARGDIAAADAAFRDAVEHLGRRAQLREAAQAAKDWAKMLRAAGRESEALDALERATLLALRGSTGAARTATSSR